MIARKKSTPKGRRIAVEFSPGELEIVADLVDCKLTAIQPEDRQDDHVERQLQAVADRIKALGPLREPLHLPGRFGGRAARGEGGAA